MFTSLVTDGQTNRKVDNNCGSLQKVTACDLMLLNCRTANWYM